MAIGIHHSSPQASIRYEAKRCTGVAGWTERPAMRASTWSMIRLVSLIHSPSGVTMTGITAAPVLRLMRRISVNMSTALCSNGACL